MAVSGRKFSDFQGSISNGSAEDFDHRCEPCLAIGQQIEAHGFCVDCQEYLCKNCFAYHQRTKASYHHQLVNKDNMGKHVVPAKDSGVCTEMCRDHKTEVIKFFCPNHEALGCHDCMTMNHRTCKIDYIPDKCSGIGDSAEFREVMRELDQKVNEAEDVLKLASCREKELDSCHDRLLKEIALFRKEVNDRLDQLQKQIQTDADKKKFTDQQAVKKVLETCTSISSDIKQLQSRLQDYKASQQNGQLYITMKQAKSKLKSDEIKEAGRSLETTNMQYTFEQNQDLKKTCFQDKMHLESSQCRLVTTKRRKSVDKLTHKENIYIRTKSAQKIRYIRGCVVRSSNKLVAADWNNEKLKVVDIKTKLY
ncbi:E3 ubiquitin-protein ligase TRIM33-like [Mercenaria mercenaria]|uniref:E3 ubiquitin-protein ligase TRIM33-like n=1 Tax=Mercenaria mercenaria TaxID=6596 RepID=UPI00234EC689|nr:E3 ubiquitin-protein ligase TRIM33-like [Mercenaria mercenaria]